MSAHARLEVRSLAGVPPRGDPLRAALDGLNRASRRPSPFAALDYLELLLAHPEGPADEVEPLLLVAFEGGAPVGWLPLSRARGRSLGLPARLVQLLAGHDVDRLGLLAGPADEERCADAFLQHLLRLGGFDALVFAQQDEQSPLRRSLALRAPLHRARLLPSNPNSTIWLEGRSAAEWFAGLEKSHRHNVGRLARRLLGRGEVALLRGEGPEACGPLLRLYLDVERRSWKQAARAGIGRSPARVALFEAQCAPGCSAKPVVHLLTLDGLPIAGHFGATFEGGLYAREIAFDEAYAADAPGHLLLLLLVADASARALRFVNLMGQHVHYKKSWGATVTEAANVQLFRVGSAPWVSSLLGDLRRRLRPAAPPVSNRYNPAKRAVQPAGQAAPADPETRPAPPERSAALALALEVLGSLGAAGLPVERICGAALEAALPFPSRSPRR